MQKTVTEEGKKEEKLYDSFMCYCKTGTGDLAKSIEAAEQKIPQVQNSLEAAEQLKAQLDGEIARAKADKAAAKATLDKTKALRAKEAKQFAKASEEFKTNIVAMGKALDALSRGSEGSFLQSASANVLRRLAVDADMSSADRDAVATFLSAGGSSGQDSSYEPQSDQIIGILKQMTETMQKELADAEATEEQAIQDTESLVAAKTKEVEALTKAIEAKLESSGQLALEVVEHKEDLEDTEETLAADKKFAAELKVGCTTKEAEWEERCKVRTNELLALADTIKLLNDDDALGLFKKTIPSASLLQIRVTGKSMARAAQAALHRSRGGPRDPRLALVSLALNGGTRNFEKVLKMIDEMVALLGKEQLADDQKRDYCTTELDQAEDDKKELDTAYEDVTKAIDDGEATVETLTKEIAALADGIKELDKSVQEATENRRAENSEYKHTMSENRAAMEILKMAKNRLAKFYNPKMYKPETGLAQEGGAPQPPPATWEAYKKKGEESAGVVAMMDTLMADLQKSITESESEEKSAQATYEDMVKVSSEKRTADSRSISEKEGAKADLEATLQKMAIEKKDTTKELYAKELTIKDLHLECDWLLKNFDVRKSARESEVDSLKKAQAVLSGADYAL